MLGLLTRGYFCPGRGSGSCPPCGPGPDIADVESLSPEIGGLVDTSPPGPSITGQVTSAPIISGGASDPLVSPADPPTISGGGPLVPGVNSED